MKNTREDVKLSNQTRAQIETFEFVYIKIGDTLQKNVAIKLHEESIKRLKFGLKEAKGSSMINPFSDSIALKLHR